MNLCVGLKVENVVFKNIAQRMRDKRWNVALRKRN